VSISGERRWIVILATFWSTLWTVVDWIVWILCVIGVWTRAWEREDKKEDNPKSGVNMDPVRAACWELLKELKNKNVPLTANDPDHQVVVFVYSGDDWELFSHAIRQTVDRVQEQRHWFLE
jgi:hypothetical protein